MKVNSISSSPNSERFIHSLILPPLTHKKKQSQFLNYANYCHSFQPLAFDTPSSLTYKHYSTAIGRYSNAFNLIHLNHHLHLDLCRFAAFYAITWETADSHCPGVRQPSPLLSVLILLAIYFLFGLIRWRSVPPYQSLDSAFSVRLVE